MTEQTFSALVLAGSRAQANDPLLEAAGVSHKCFIDLEGEPMLARVVESLTGSGRIGHVIVSINSEVIPQARTMLEHIRWDGTIDFVPAGVNFGESFTAVDEAFPDAFPLVVTTGDNGLHTAEMVAHFCDVIEHRRMDVAVALTRAELILARYPDGQRAFHDLKDGAYSSCNLYALMTRDALSGVHVFNSGGQFGKKPWRIVASFGVIPFLLYKLQRLSLKALMARVSDVLRLRVEPVIMPYADAPIDVDSPGDLEKVRRILRVRDGGDGSGGDGSGGDGSGGGQDDAYARAG